MCLSYLRERHQQARCVRADLDKVAQRADLALALWLEAGARVGVLHVLGALRTGEEQGGTKDCGCGSAGVGQRALAAAAAAVVSSSRVRALGVALAAR